MMGLFGIRSDRRNRPTLKRGVPEFSGFTIMSPEILRYPTIYGGSFRYPQRPPEPTRAEAWGTGRFSTF